MNISELWKKNAEFVLSVCLRYVKELDIAEDIRQEVFLKIINTRKSFKNECGIRTWLYSIAYRCCLDYFRLRKRRTEMIYEYSLINALYAKEAEFPVWNVNSPYNMPCPISQLIMELYYEEGWSKQEIAKVFGLNVAQVSRRIQTGLNNLENFVD